MTDDVKRQREGNHLNENGGEENTATAPQPPKPQLTLLGLLLIMAAGPLWAYMIVEGGRSPGFGTASGSVTVFVALSGITLALHALFRGQTNAWAWCFFLSPTIALLVLLLVAWFAGSFEA